MRRTKRRAPIAIVGIVLALVCVGVVALIAIQAKLKREITSEGTIAENIQIGEVAVGKMHTKEAQDAVQSYVDQIMDKKFTVTTGETKLEATAEQLGLTWKNTGVVKEAEAYGKEGSVFSRYRTEKGLKKKAKKFPLELEAKKEVIETFFKEKAPVFEQDAVDATLTRENGQFVVTDGKNGVKLDIEKSIENTEAFLKNWNGSDTEIQLTADIVKPKASKEQLAKIKDVLGTYSTDYSSSPSGRKQNVKTGAEKINGKLLYPGETFSVYEAVSPFDEEHGYALAGSYENGTTVETYGGGICQVSTTLYNAVIRAELGIEERFCHSMVVHYVEPSEDAAIAGTYKDLKFKNDKDTPIYIEGSADGATLTFTVYGEETRPANREVSFESEIVKKIDSRTKYVSDGSKKIGYRASSGSSHTGYIAKLWKIIKIDGKEQSREEFNSSEYKSTNIVVSIGTASSDANASAIVSSAVASQNAGAIDSAIAQAQAAEAAAAQAAAQAQAQAEAEAAAQAQAQAEAEAAAQAQQEQQEQQQEQPQQGDAGNGEATGGEAQIGDTVPGQ